MIVTTSEAADHVGVSVHVIRKWVERGILKPINPGMNPARYQLRDVIEAHYTVRPKSWKERLRGLADRLT